MTDDFLRRFTKRIEVIDQQGQNTWISEFLMGDGQNEYEDIFGRQVIFLDHCQFKSSVTGEIFLRTP